MAKKSGKKDEKSSKESISKSPKPVSKSEKPPKGPGPEPKGGAAKGGAPTGESGREAKALKPGKPSRGRKAFADEGREGGGTQKGFLPENLPDDDEEKDFVDEFDTRANDAEEEQEDDEEEEEEESEPF